MAEENIELELAHMKQKLAVMEWDIDKRQINPARKVKYDKLKEEYDRLKQELESSTGKIEQTGPEEIKNDVEKNESIKEIEEQ